MKPGFTLLEIILATALAAVISVALIFMLQQMNGTLMRVDRISDLDMRAALLQNQMERDIMGAFAPTDFSETTTTETDKGPKKIEKIFWGDNKLETLTFITNNPLQAYWGERSGKPQPKIVRVVYRLIPDQKRKDVYTLMRQEGSDLNLESYTSDSTSNKAYAMIEGIRSIQVTYTTLIKKEKTKEEPTKSTAGKEQAQETSAEKTIEEPASAEKEFERKVVDEWKTNIEDQKPPWPLIPQFVTMKVMLWDDAFKRTTSFTFEFQIIPRFEKPEKQEKQAGFGLGTIMGIGKPS